MNTRIRIPSPMSAAFLLGILLLARPAFGAAPPCDPGLWPDINTRMAGEWSIDKREGAFTGTANLVPRDGVFGGVIKVNREPEDRVEDGMVFYDYVTFRVVDNSGVREEYWGVLGMDDKDTLSVTGFYTDKRSGRKALFTMTRQGGPPVAQDGVPTTPPEPGVSDGGRPVGGIPIDTPTPFQPTTTGPTGVRPLPPDKGTYPGTTTTPTPTGVRPTPPGGTSGTPYGTAGGGQTPIVTTMPPDPGTTPVAQPVENQGGGWYFVKMEYRPSQKDYASTGYENDMRSYVIRTSSSGSEGDFTITHTSITKSSGEVRSVEKYSIQWNRPPAFIPAGNKLTLSTFTTIHEKHSSARWFPVWAIMYPFTPARLDENRAGEAFKENEEQYFKSGRIDGHLDYESIHPIPERKPGDTMALCMRSHNEDYRFYYIYEWRDGGAGAAANGATPAGGGTAAGSSGVRPTPPGQSSGTPYGTVGGGQTSTAASTPPVSTPTPVVQPIVPKGGAWVLSKVEYRPSDMDHKTTGKTHRWGATETKFFAEGSAGDFTLRTEKYENKRFSGEEIYNLKWDVPPAILLPGDRPTMSTTVTILKKNPANTASFPDWRLAFPLEEYRPSNPTPGVSFSRDSAVQDKEVTANYHSRAEVPGKDSRTLALLLLTTTSHYGFYYLYEWRD